MLFLVFGIAAAIGAIVLTTYSLLTPFSSDDPAPYDAFPSTGDGETCL